MLQCVLAVLQCELKVGPGEVAHFFVWVVFWGVSFFWGFLISKLHMLQCGAVFLKCAIVWVSVCHSVLEFAALL